METIAFRDLRHAILTERDHRCHYCASTAHQIHQTTDQQWTPICRACRRKLHFIAFPNVDAVRAHLTKDRTPALRDTDMELLRRGIERDGLI